MSDVADSRWRVLPLGRTEVLRRAAQEAVTFGLIGLVGVLISAIAMGAVIEEVFAETETGIAADLVLRASLAGVLLFGVIGLLALGAVGALTGPVAARQLVTAARRGVPATEVPVPEQWEAATESSAGAYKLLAGAVLALLGLFYVILLFAVLGDPDATGWALLVGGGVLLTAIWSGIPIFKRLVEPRQMELAAEVERWWTPAHRDRAAEQELTEEAVRDARSQAGLGDRLPARRVRAVNDLLALVTALSLVGWGFASHVSLAMAHPDRTYGPSPQLGERADLDPEAERLVDLVTVGGGVLAAVGGLVFVLMLVTEVIIWRVERQALRRALADEDAAPPPHALLQRALRRACPPALRLMFAMCGATLAFGFGLWFITLVADRPDWDTYAAASDQVRALASRGPWVMLGAIGVLGLGVVLGGWLDSRDQALRDALVQRWPVRVDDPTEEDSEGESEGSTEQEGAGAEAPVEGSVD